MKDISNQWSISTISLFLDNINEGKLKESLYDKGALTVLLNILIIEHRELFLSLGDLDESVQCHFVAIQDIRSWIKSLEDEENQ